LKDIATGTTALFIGTSIIGNPCGMIMGSLQLQELNFISFINTKTQLFDETTSGLKFSHISEWFGQPFQDDA
jgi:hypothetical protein